MGRWMSFLEYQRALDVVCKVRKMSDVGLNGALYVLIEISPSAYPAKGFIMNV
jgi:hypothetical protein